MGEQKFNNDEDDEFDPFSAAFRDKELQQKGEDGYYSTTNRDGVDGGGAVSFSTKRNSIGGKITEGFDALNAADADMNERYPEDGGTN